MHLVLIAWLYVAALMAVAEAVSPIGSVLGAGITFVLYGLGPAALVGYILGTPGRRRAAQTAPTVQRGTAIALATDSLAPDADGKAATDAVAPVRKEP